MTRKDIVRMAREAGISQDHAQGMTLFLERFAELVASAEREACIKAIEDQIGWDMDDPESTAIEAIRARKQT